MTKKEYEQRLDEELKHNKELAVAIGNDPEKKVAYIAKLMDSENALAGNSVMNFRQCSTCVFSKSKVIAENGAHKGWCRTYSKEAGIPKPFAILRDEQTCKYWRSNGR